ncbi:hypothetical protein NKJ20_33850, partial [Mesorhizobium sp. M0185]
MGIRSLPHERAQVHHVTGHRWFLRIRLCQQPDLAGELSMTTAKPLARYSAIESALASGFDTAELHHLWGRDR